MFCGAFVGGGMVKLVRFKCTSLLFQRATPKKFFFNFAVFCGAFVGGSMVKLVRYKHASLLFQRATPKKFFKLCCVLWSICGWEVWLS